MDESQLRELSEDFLVPLIAGAQLEPNSVKSAGRDGLVSLRGVCNIRFKAEKSDSYRLTLHRRQPFAPVTKGVLSESDVVEAFVKVVCAMKDGLRSSYKSDLRATFPRRVVAKAICADSIHEDAVLAVIDQFSVWAGQQYEGKPISAAVGFDPLAGAGPIVFNHFCRESFSAVLSNGHDTMFVCNFSGEVIRHETLQTPSPGVPPLSACATWPKYAPYRMGAIAHWTSPGRIAVVLNRTGEILIFNDQQLRFVKRGGQWHFLTHEPVITQMRRPDDDKVREAIYSTCLDASFARTGACIGVVTSGHAKKWQNVALSVADHLLPPNSLKAKLISNTIGGRKFQELDRRLRQEIVAIDGATLIDHKGTVLAVGAILKVPGGSTGGGRLAAAKALSNLGLGIKVSQDGGISGFHDGKDAAKFNVM